MFSTIAAYGQELTVTATVDRNQMRLGDTFTYSISVSSQNGGSFDDPKLPDLSDFDVLNTWQSSEMRGTFVGGQIQTVQSKNFNYQLAPRREGNLQIGAAEVTASGKLLRTNPITIQVSQDAGQGQAQLPGGRMPQQPRAQQQQQDPDPIQDQLEEIDRMDQMFNQLLERHLGRRRGGGGAPGVGGGMGSGGLATGDPRDGFFIQVVTDKTRAYVGESIVVTWYLVANANILDIDTLKYPSLSGFWKEDIELATRLNFQPEIINGIRYNKALLVSYSLYPLQPGKAKIDSYKAKCRAMGTNQIGFPQEVVLTRESDEIEVEVLPLPEEGKPATFTGGVGNFQVTARVDARDPKTNQPIPFKVRVEGQGNAKFAEFPPLTPPDGVELYDTKSETKFFPPNRSYKEFETLLIPRKAGTMTVPAVEISFFDPVTKKYYSQTTSPQTINVAQGTSAPLIPSSDYRPDGEAPKRGPTLPQPAIELEAPAALSMADHFTLWAALYAFSLLGLGIYGWRELGRREKRADLRKRIRERMGTVRKHLDGGDWRKVGVESINMIYATLGEISGVGGAAFEFEKLVEKSPPSFRREVAPKLAKVMQQLQAVGFAPEGVVGNLKEKKQLSALVDEAEKALLEAAKYDFTSLDKTSEQAAQSSGPA